MTKNYFSLYAFDRPHRSRTRLMFLSIALLAASLVLWMHRGVRAASSSLVPETAAVLPMTEPVPAPSALQKTTDLPSAASALQTPRTAEPVRPSAASAPAADSPTRSSALLGDVPGYQTYAFTFQGHALSVGQPVANAHILLHFILPRETRTLETTTGADGRYLLKTTFGSRLNDSIEWTIEGQAFQRSAAQVEGRRIITPDLETNVTLDQPLEFVED